jgi:hypothetical protein
MSFNEKHFEINSEQDMPAFTADSETYLSPEPAIYRRTFLAAGAAVGGGVLLGQMAGASSGGGADAPLLKEYDIETNGITLHVSEQGRGPAVLFCHGFPDTSYTWRRQMKAIASAGYRAIAPDMRGYGHNSAPADATLYTPLHTCSNRYDRKPIRSGPTPQRLRPGQ